MVFGNDEVVVGLVVEPSESTSSDFDEALVSAIE